MATQDCWDLHYPSHQFMITSQIKDKIQVQHSKDTAGNTVYLVRYAEDPRPAPWTLVVRLIVLANLLRNFPGIANSVDAVIRCVSIGAPFHTVLAIRTANISVPSAAHQRNRVRAPVLYRYGESADKVKMRKSDYHAARIRALAVLGDTQIRGALSEGGILWRLAQKILSVDGDVYYGAINIYNGMMDSEAGILWGRYQRYCKQGDTHLTVEELSWWPKPESWNVAGFYTHNEDYFQKRLTEIGEERGHPMKASDWRSSLRQTQIARTLAGMVDRATDRVFQQHLLKF
ncbi:hypothetical protein K466DRAFT_571330 [Polyporus arcularius HHB13444]|uniref:Uncharacterized protein n=1 Tax=Polyporus arcularius HHB13444 TaxID=1314778 RepID=A0A5C3NP15_9APHY|nr:hypothetical protein K466DRAFT_571330 [Polyporus arcularius HHB13444]